MIPEAFCLIMEKNREPGTIEIQRIRKMGFIGGGISE